MVNKIIFIREFYFHKILIRGLLLVAKIFTYNIENGDKWNNIFQIFSARKIDLKSVVEKLRFFLNTLYIDLSLLVWSTKKRGSHLHGFLRDALHQPGEKESASYDSRKSTAFIEDIYVF